MKGLKRQIGKLFFFSTIFIVLSNFSGCTVWYNFTTYFNLYYNTTDIFSQAEESILAEKKDIFAFNEPNVPSNVIQQLNKVIEKCSKILQFNTESSFVDDALFIIGKCFYYQKNYPKALRKFEELLAEFPESSLALETKLWVARTTFQMRNFSEALTQVESVKKEAYEEDDDDILISAYIEQIKYLIFKENYDDAIVLAEELVNNSSNDEINAQTLYQLGEMYYLVGEFENAASAYKSVLDFSPSFDTELFARLKYGKMLRLLGSGDSALEIFKKLRSEEKNSISFDAIELEIGITYKELGEFDEALTQLTIVDTAYGSTIYGGAARYEIGSLYEYHFLNFDSAHTYYQKAYSSTASAEYLPKIRLKQPQFNKYKTLSTTLLGYSKQLFYVENPEEFEKDSIAFHSETMLEDENKEQKAQDPGRTPGRERDFGDPSTSTTQSTSIQQVKQPPLRPVLSKDTLTTLIVRTKFELANLFFTEMNKLDSSYHYYYDLEKNYPESSLRPQILFALGNYYLTIGESQKSDSIFNFIYDHYQEDRIVNASAAILKRPLIEFDREPAKAVYLEAEDLMKEKNYNASVKKFYNIYVDFPGSNYAPKSLHAAGFVLEEKLNLYDSAASVYDTLITHYPKSEHASKVSPRLTFFKQEKQRIEAMIQDSIRKVDEERTAKIAADSIQKAMKLDSLKKIEKKDSLNNIVPPDTYKEKEDEMIQEENPDEGKEIEELDSAFLLNNLRFDIKSVYRLDRTYNKKIC